ncbi:hypothetical protein ONS95_002106 [Cadophora gregata]|uniref:uncharacterized protein n=1 Tax=Cadophora gregata TaxID=51156 RepID=UPI0026DB93BB|nr:uncharacterized protein ONS95_002106 [Cadophora gregata]KAK0109408.1 hypothetical protein ONS95_002106 [Cadophora gregata]KAK0110961.1 hypothetical protein ONS96_002545 [Cadophora gregata f. sp. sojae]
MSLRQMPPQSKPFSIAIIGGGIGGLCLALGLIRRGIPVQVYEQAPEFGEIGQGVAFGPNSARAMKLVDPAIREAFDRLATHAAEEETEGIGRTWINFRYGGDNTDMIAKIQTFDSDLTGLSSVHRARFMEELVKLVPEGIANFNKRFFSMKNLESGQIEITFADGSTARSDAVVGCDGIRSSVRQVLLARKSAEEDLSFSGTVAYRAIIPMEKAKEALGEGFAVNAQMFLAPGGHVLCYPIDHGKTVNVIASVNKGEAWNHEGWVIKDAKYDDMKRDFVGWCDEVQNVISMIKDHHPDKWALFDTLPLPTFYKANVALLGDSAHATLPHQGSGAGQAVEDALILAEVLADVNTKTAADIPMAFKAYDAIRRPRSQKVVKTSRQAGEMYNFQGPYGRDLNKLRDDALSRFHWIWYEDMEVQIQRATAMLGEVIARL